MIIRPIGKIQYLTISLFIAAVVIWGYIFFDHFAKTKLDTTIKFSKTSGFYDTPIDVEVSVGSSYFMTYTLDGTEPTMTSTRYEKAIYIDDASNNENIWSAKKETTPWHFLSDDKDIHALPMEKVDKCTVLRVAAFDYEGNKVGSKTQEYFVGFKDKTGYDGLYTICITPEPSDYFDENTGIYSLGSDFRERIDSGNYSGWSMQKEGSYANFMRHGREYERRVNVEIFDSEHNLILDTVCGSRIRGHGSRFYPQKTLSLISRKEYSGSDYFDWDVFGDGVGPHNFLVFNGGNDADVKLIDYLVFNALKDDDMILSATKLYPCNCFIDGEYWGPMFIMEDLNSEYISRRLGVSEDNVRLLKSLEYDGDEIIADTGKDYNDWAALEKYIKENDMSNESCFSYVCDRMDIKDFADYAATEIYIGNRDWHFDNNFASWRLEKTEKDSEFADGKWRFAIFDINWAFQPDEKTEDDQYEDWDCYAMVEKLMENPEFKLLFESRVDKLATVFSSERINAIIDEWLSLMEEPMEGYYERFCSRPGVENQTYSEIESIKQFLVDRDKTVKRMFE